MIFGLVILFACHQIIAGLFRVHNWSGLNADSWAAWVQAIGSVAALAIAIYIMYQQNAHSAELVADADRLATLRRARSVHAVLVRSRNQIAGICKLAKTVSAHDTESLESLAMQLSNGIEIVDTIEKRMAEIPVFDLGAYKMSDGVMQMTELLLSIRPILVDLEQHPRGAGSAAVVRAFNRFEEIQQEGLNKFESGMKELDKPKLKTRSIWRSEETR